MDAKKTEDAQKAHAESGGKKRQNKAEAEAKRQEYAQKEEPERARAGEAAKRNAEEEKPKAVEARRDEATCECPNVTPQDVRRHMSHHFAEHTSSHIHLLSRCLQHGEVGNLVKKEKVVENQKMSRRTPEGLLSPPEKKEVRQYLAWVDFGGRVLT